MRTMTQATFIQINSINPIIEINFHICSMASSLVTLRTETSIPRVDQRGSFSFQLAMEGLAEYYYSRNPQI